MVWFGRKGKDCDIDTIFWLKDKDGNNDKTVKVVQAYVYLGVDVKSNKSWKDFNDKLIRKSRRCMAMSWGMGIQVGGLSTKAAINAWKALIRPVLEYAAEVVDHGANGEWEEAERIQLSMAKRILGAQAKTTDAAVRGELGWWTLKGRRDMLRLRYWGKLTRMKSKRWTRRVYVRSREEFEKGEKTWCTYTHKLLHDLDMEGVWESEETGDKSEWNTRVFEAIQEREIVMWREQLKSKPKLRTYETIKNELELELYLSSSTNTAGRKIMSAIRTGSNVLRIETGRYWNPMIPVEERICWCCGEAVEDEKHFVIHCREYDEERSEMFQAISRVTDGMFTQQQLVNTQTDQLFKMLLGGEIGCNESEVICCVQTFLVRAMRKRRKFLERAWGVGKGVY